MNAILPTDFYQPFKEDEFEQSTEVPIIYPIEPKPVIMIYKLSYRIDSLWVVWDIFSYSMVMNEISKFLNIFC